MSGVPPSVQQVTREIPALSIRASVRPGSVDVEKRTLEVVWTTGARVLRSPWFGDPFYEELSLDPKHVRMGRLTSGRAPFLDSHSTWGRVGDVVLGVVENATLNGRESTARIRFPEEGVDPEADKVFRKMADGICPNVSVGYRIYKLEKVEDGLEKLPVYRATDWEPHEISCVPMGADPDAAVRGAQGGTTNPCTFVFTREESTQMVNPQPAAPAATPTTTAPAAVPAEETRAAPSAPAPSSDEKVLAERTRAAEINRLATKHQLPAEFAQRMISEGHPIDVVRAKVLDELATRSDAVQTEQHQRVEVGEEDAEKWVRGASAWLIQKAGLTPMLREAKAKFPEHPAFRDLAFDPGQFRGASLSDLARNYLERRGGRVGLMSKEDVVKRAFAERGGLGGLATTSDFSVLLENTLHKTLLGAYMTTPDTWSRWCGTASLNDFRTHNRYRLGSFGVLDDLNESGELKNKSIPDGEKKTLALGTKGNIIGLTRQAIVNDDMGAFTGLATMLGRAGKLTIEKAVYTKLLLNGGLGPTQSDAQPFFHSNRSNVNATGSAISVAGLDADKVVMASQKDPSSNEYLELRPAVLLVPLSLESEGKVLNDAQFDPVDSKFQKPNRVRGLVRDVVGTPRLTGTRRYLFADPAIAPAFVVSFRDGQQEPMLKSEEGWRTDGMEWRVILDFGVDEFDPRGAVTNAGV